MVCLAQDSPNKEEVGTSLVLSQSEEALYFFIKCKASSAWVSSTKSDSILGEGVKFSPTAQTHRCILYVADITYNVYNAHSALQLLVK